MIKTLRRWRTWIFNGAAAIALALPDVINGLTGIYWGDIVPSNYLPYFTIFIVLVNIWMRPRAAVLPDDDEARR